MKALILISLFSLSAKAGQSIESGWLTIDKAEDAPSCEYLKQNHIDGLQSADTYEITTDELCELGGTQ